MGEVGTVKSGMGFPDIEQGGTEGVPFFKVSDMNIKGNEHELVVANNYVTSEQITRKRWNVINDVPAILFAKVGAAVMLNRKRLVRSPFLLDNNTMVYIFDKKIWDCDFGKTLFETIDLTKLTQVGALPSYNASDVENVSIIIPDRAEQEIVGKYFRQLDHLITLHQCKRRVLPKLLYNDWEQRKLNEIADKVSEKNKNNEFSEPFTNSAEQGIISQKDYFDREIVNDENLNGYYIVRNDDFIYNPRISVTAPVGPINRNRLGRNGVISPLYTVFRTHDIDNLYLEFYFKTTKWHRFMKLNGDSGARFDRFTISSTQFMEMPIPYPTLEEQRKIGAYFESLATLITLHHRKYISILKSL